jgi:hypothetical protein
MKETSFGSGEWLWIITLFIGAVTVVVFARIGIVFLWGFL